MNKEEFLTKLRKKLSILEDSEIEDIVSEYEGYIEEKVGSGLTEEEAVKELGDFDEIVNDLLAAYKVKVPSNEEGGFTKFINYLGDGLDNLMDSLNNKSGKDIVKFLIEIIIIIFIIALLKIPFTMVKNLAYNIFYELGSPLNHIFRTIWFFITDISYIIVSIVFFIKMLEKRYFKNISEEIISTTENETEEIKTTKVTKKKSSKEEDNETKSTEKVTKTPSNHSFTRTLTNLCIYFLKFLVLMFTIGIIFYLIGMSIALGFGIYLLFHGVKYFGILLLLITLFLGGAFCLEICVNFLFNRKNRALPILSKLVALIILTGLSLTFSGIEIASTELIYENNYPEKIITKELTMSDNLCLYNYDNIIVDNTLGNTIRLEYSYPDFDNNLNINIDLNKCGNGYCLDYDVRHISWNKKLLNTLIKNLKQKRIYVYDFHVKKNIFLSEENYQKLLTSNNNDQYYYDDYYNDDDYYDDNYYYNGEFTKTYTILNITESNHHSHFYLTIKESESEEVRTVKIPCSLAEHVEVNKTYIFTFQASHIHHSQDIFKYCNLVSIRELNPANPNPNGI